MPLQIFQRRAACRRFWNVVANKDVSSYRLHGLFQLNKEIARRRFFVQNRRFIRETANLHIGRSDKPLRVLAEKEQSGAVQTVFRKR